jgi:hypothetical protein
MRIAGLSDQVEVFVEQSSSHNSQSFGPMEGGEGDEALWGLSFELTGSSVVRPTRLNFRDLWGTWAVSRAYTYEKFSLGHRLLFDWRSG